MQINQIVLNVFDKVFNNNKKGMILYVELERLKVECIFSEKNKEKQPLLVKTINSTQNKHKNNHHYQLNKQQTMNSLYYEYTINWWRRKNGHFNEELYKTILIERAPELFK